MADMTDAQIRFNRAVPVEKIRRAFEKRERDAAYMRPYPNDRPPSFELSETGQMYASKWVQSKYGDYAAGYYDAAWDAHCAALQEASQ